MQTIRLLQRSLLAAVIGFVGLGAILSAPIAVAQTSARPADPASYTASANASASPWVVTGTIPLGGEGGWDYLTMDPASRRLYVSRSTRAVVVDVDSRKVVGEIPDTKGIHGIALAPGIDRGFTSNGGSSTVTAFSLSKLEKKGEVKTTGENPDAILFDPFTSRVFTFNGRGQNATAIDAKTLAVAGTIALDGKPEFGVSDGAGRVFVNIEDKNLIEVIDAKALRVTAKWSLAPCDEPSALVFDSAHKRLFAGCHNKMVAVVSSDTGKVVTTFPIGEGVDAAGFDAAKGNVFASCGDGTLTVAHQESPDDYRVVATVPTTRGARTLAFDAKTRRVFLMSAEYGPRPAPTADRPNPRPPILPDTAALVVVAPAARN
jgi:DNA-binding beta-propeller fold protein YncE